MQFPKAAAFAALASGSVFVSGCTNEMSCWDHVNRELRLAEDVVVLSPGSSHTLVLSVVTDGYYEFDTWGDIDGWINFSLAGGAGRYIQRHDRDVDFENRPGRIRHSVSEAEPLLITVEITYSDDGERPVINFGERRYLVLEPGETGYFTLSALLDERFNSVMCSESYLRTRNFTVIVTD
ncbi:MAG: hypothetical protein ACQRW7_05740 [Caulobacterales bacterium]|uniref:hypothetical protein n=1 Tax=Glycocaulis sp. TaxID=1969725 RepID=UPI003F9FB179